MQIQDYFSIRQVGINKIYSSTQLDYIYTAAESIEGSGVGKTIGKAFLTCDCTAYTRTVENMITEEATAHFQCDTYHLNGYSYENVGGVHNGCKDFSPPLGQVIPVINNFTHRATLETYKMKCEESIDPGIPVGYYTQKTATTDGGCCPAYTAQKNTTISGKYEAVTPESIFTEYRCAPVGELTETCRSPNSCATGISYISRCYPFLSFQMKAGPQGTYLQHQADTCFEATFEHSISSWRPILYGDANTAKDFNAVVGIATEYGKGVSRAVYRFAGGSANFDFVYKDTENSISSSFSVKQENIITGPSQKDIGYYIFESAKAPTNKYFGTGTSWYTLNSRGNAGGFEIFYTTIKSTTTWFEHPGRSTGSIADNYIVFGATGQPCGGHLQWMDAGDFYENQVISVGNSFGATDGNYYCYEKCYGETHFSYVTTRSTARLGQDFFRVGVYRTGGFLNNYYAIISTKKIYPFVLLHGSTSYSAYPQNSIGTSKNPLFIEPLPQADFYDEPVVCYLPEYSIGESMVGCGKYVFDTYSLTNVSYSVRNSVISTTKVNNITDTIDPFISQRFSAKWTVSSYKTNKTTSAYSTYTHNITCDLKTYDSVSMKYYLTSKMDQGIKRLEGHNVANATVVCGPGVVTYCTMLPAVAGKDLERTFDTLTTYATSCFAIEFDSNGGYFWANDHFLDVAYTTEGANSPDVVTFYAGGFEFVPTITGSIQDANTPNWGTGYGSNLFPRDKVKCL